MLFWNSLGTKKVNKSGPSEPVSSAQLDFSDNNPKARHPKPNHVANPNPADKVDTGRFLVTNGNKKIAVDKIRVTL